MSDQKLAPEAFRLRLESAFDDEPPSVPVHEYERAGRRRLFRQRALVAMGCAVAVVIPVSATVLSSALPRGSEGLPVTADEGVPDGWQIEMSNGTTFAVPPWWQPGDPSQWCTREERSPSPLVFLAGNDFSTAVQCLSPRYWYGAALTPDDLDGPSLTDEVVQYHAPDDELPAFPDGSWGVEVDAGTGWKLTVVAPSRDVAEQIVASLRHS